MDAFDFNQIKRHLPTQTGKTPSNLKSKQSDVPEYMLDFFFDLFTKSPSECPETKLKYLELRNSKRLYDVDRIVLRDCYADMERKIHKEVMSEKFCRLAVAGTPGIGKTVYGVLLNRRFVREQKLAIVYWEREHVYYFSWKEEDRERFGLKSTFEVGGKSLYYGYWTQKAASSSADLWSEKDVLVIHDPAENYTGVGKSATHIRRSIFVLSHGHALITFWNDKPETRPNPYLYLPLWAQIESTKAFRLWRREPPHDAFLLFGGCIRGWLYPSMWAGLVHKAKDVVKRHGDDVLGRTLDKRGSIVHLDVKYDASKGEQNRFSEFTYRFASERIIQAVDDAILDSGDQALKLCLQNWTSESGFESIYGGLFELRCQRLFTNRSRGPLKLHARRVFRDSARNDDKVYQVTLPPIGSLLRYESNDPSCIGEDDNKDSIKSNSYFWPFSSNHPTYDSAMIVSGSVIGLPKKENAALLMQMTVSGATGLPRRPKHSMKQHVRKKFDSTFATHVQGYKPDSAVTAFVVPPECFAPFLFQEETVMDNDDTPTVAQPDYQLVLQVSNMFKLRKSHRDHMAALPPLSDEAKRKIHKFDGTLRKRQKINYKE